MAIQRLERLTPGTRRIQQPLEHFATSDRRRAPITTLCLSARDLTRVANNQLRLHPAIECGRQRIARFQPHVRDRGKGVDHRIGQRRDLRYLV